MEKGWLRGIFNRPGQRRDDPPAPSDILAAFERAVALHQQGRLADAKAVYAQILELQPDHFDALQLSGVVQFQLGEFSDSVRLIENAIQINPNLAPTHANLGLALQKLGRAHDALASYDRALALNPDYADALFNRGNTLRELTRHEEALQCYERSIALRPQYAEALNNRGLLLIDLKRSEDALHSFDKAIATRSGYFEAMNNRGTALLALGRFQEALENYDAILALNPGYPPAQNNRGAALGGLQRHEDALASYARVLALEPGNAEAHYNRGVTLGTLKKHEAALESYNRALELKSNYAEALNARGTTYRDLGRHREAIADYERALAIRPEFAEALDNCGVVLASLGRHEDALASYDRALSLRPGFASALSNRAAVLREIGEQTSALDGYRQAIEADPFSLAVRFKRLIASIPILANDAKEVALSRARFTEEIGLLEAWSSTHGLDDEQQAVGAAQPFHLAYQEDCNRELLGRYGRLCCLLMARWQTRNNIPAARKRTPAGPRMRVGIASAHLHNHSVWNAIVKGWLEKIDRRRFEIEVFHLGTVHDAETDFAAARCDRFTHGDRSLKDWATAISERALDVLIYPEVGMDITTPRLASMRLAPVQIAAWGHPETTGFPTIDYYLSAEGFETADSQTHYTEKLVALPNLGCYYAPEAVADEKRNLRDFGVADGSPLFICPGTPFKYAPQHDRVFVEITRQLDDARFVFFTFGPVPLLSQRLRGRIAAAFAKAGLDCSKHLIFVPWQSKAGFYAMLRQADACLDTIGFSGFNTAMQAIECGLPIVTREGRFMRGRFASAILQRMQLDELVSDSDASYVACAIRLALDREYKAAVREKIRNSRHILYRDKAPIHALESFLAGLKTEVPP